MTDLVRGIYDSVRATVATQVAAGNAGPFHVVLSPERYVHLDKLYAEVRAFGRPERVTLRAAVLAIPGVVTVRKEGTEV